MKQNWELHKVVFIFGVKIPANMEHSGKILSKL